MPQSFLSSGAVRPADPAPDHALAQRLIQAFLSLDAEAQERIDDALDGGPLPAEPVERWIVQQLRASADLDALVAERTAAAFAGRPSLSDWHHFWRRHPNKVDEFRARGQFFALPWGVDFQRDFWEGHDRHLAWRLMLRKPADNPYWWLHNRCWTDRPQGPNGRPVIGEAERKRLGRERQNVQRLLQPLAGGLAMPFQPVENWQESAVEWFAQRIAHGADPSIAEGLDADRARRLQERIAQIRRERNTAQ